MSGIWFLRKAVQFVKPFACSQLKVVRTERLALPLQQFAISSSKKSFSSGVCDEGGDSDDDFGHVSLPEGWL
jgi:hypothetical protein